MSQTQVSSVVSSLPPEMQREKQERSLLTWEFGVQVSYHFR